MRRMGLLAAALGAGAVAPLARAIDVPDYDFEWCVIGDPGNAAYPGPINYSFFPVIGRGRVQYVYRMAKTEVTTGQWVEYYNALAAVAPEIAWAERPGRSGAVFVGSQAHPHWEVGPGPGDAMRPVEIPIRAAARFCNWLHNGKAPELAAFMDGAYDASTFGWSEDLDDFTDDYTRRAGALFFMPNLDEWMKAVYHDPAKQTRDGWWHYPYGSDAWPAPGWPGEPGAETAVGTDNLVWTQLDVPLLSYPDAATPWGLRDASGGMSEWSDLRASGTFGTAVRSFGSRGDQPIFVTNPHEFFHPDELINAFGGWYPDLVPWGINLRVASAASCLADLALPFGTLDLGDVVAFVAAYVAGVPGADLAEPFGELTLDDLTRFVDLFTGGCP